MTISESGLVLGAKRYVAIYNEVSFATKVATPTRFHVPVDEYNVKMVPVNRKSTPTLGIFEEMHSQNYKGMPSGSMTVKLYGYRLPSMGTSLAQYFLDWAFGDATAASLISKVVEYAEGPNVANKAHLGLRINSATLTGSDDSGFHSLQLDLMGHKEIGEEGGTDIAGASTYSGSWTAATLPTNRYKLVDFEYCSGPSSDTIFYLGANGNEVINPKSYSIKIDNGLKPEYLNSFNPLIMPRTKRTITLQVSLAKNSDTYDAYRRLTTQTDLVGQFIFRGLHMGTGDALTNWSNVQIDMPRLAYVNHNDTGGNQDNIFQPIDFAVLKPMTSSNALAVTYPADN